MIIYNVTTKVDAAVADKFAKWMKEEHIPDVINTGCFSNARMVRLLDTDETDGLTFAVQYEAEDIANYTRYIESFANIMRQKVFDVWGNKFIAFRSVMEVL